MTRAPFLSNDYTRQTLSGIVSIVFAAGVLLPMLHDAAQDAIALHGPDAWVGPFIGDQAAVLYLVAWVSFAGLYCYATHRVYSRMGSTRLHAPSRTLRSSRTSSRTRSSSPR